jgi:uncharacterized Zn-binding protein involved in type VI secretion
MGMRTPAALALLLAAGVLGCSKTQDTAPATRIFGEPPKIGSASLVGQTNTFHCDLTLTFQAWFCSFGIDRAWYRFSPGSGAGFTGIEADISYTEFTFQVQATDPNSTAAQSDILLVTASYQTPPPTPEETSLLLLDDGGQLDFPWVQTSGLPSICSGNTCSCFNARYNLTSNDLSAGDGTFTRKFAFVTTPKTGTPVTPINGGWLIDACIASTQHEAPASSNVFLDRDVSFKIEATDREGNITEWPEKPSGHVGGTTWACKGDDCACCLTTTPDPTAECKGLPGVIATSPNAGWPVGSGFCQTAL